MRLEGWLYEVGGWWKRCCHERSPRLKPQTLKPPTPNLSSPFVPSCLRGYKIVRMKSYEVIRKAVDEPGVKAVAAALKVSPALVYKWCEPPAEEGDPDQSGAKNPLDRVRELYLQTKEKGLINWLCNEAGGFFVTNPIKGQDRSLDESIFGAKQRTQIGGTLLHAAVLR